MNIKLKVTPGIYMIGFMASGKSTVGRMLAHRLGWSFFDTDDEIQAAEKTTVAEIFDTRGEEEFRRIEKEILRQHAHWIERGRAAVLALGGGAFGAPENRRLLEDRGVTVWLDCPYDLVSQRIAKASHRPLARDPKILADLYVARREVYGLADIHVPIQGDDPAEAVEAILRHPLLK